jgi:acyl-coenzyme A thioesterase PaaI-like protein
VLASVADSACGYAALSLMDADAAVLSVEFKINMLAPAVGERFLAVGRVVRSGRTITVCTADVSADQGGAIVQVALMQATMMAVRGRKGLSD